MRQIFVEAVVRAPLPDVWRYTQVPALHARWDARFGEISYLPGTRPQQFRYATLGVAGVGVTAAERTGGQGRGTSALTFHSRHPLSPIRSGAGYWRYEPTPHGVVFRTGYDYRPGWGRAVDLVVRPLLGWLTAWSFDRLRLWLETGVAPEASRNQALAEVAARVGAVLAARRLGGGAMLLAAAVAALTPPLPGTPAARRCRRTPARAGTPSPPTGTRDRPLP
jgi:hypothetical protein